MKVKIRGLVFVGFAAAVFAQSAMADATTDAKTVTSKLYVTNYAQEQAKRVKIGNGGGTNEYASVDALTDTQWNDNSLYPSMPVLKAVKDAVAAVDVVDDGAGYVDVSVPATGANAGKYVVGLDKVPVTGNAGITGEFSNGDGNKLVTAMGVKSLIDTTAISASSDATHLPTSQAVYNYAEAKANKATAIVTSGTGQNNTSATGGDTAYPTTKAVYDFVTAQGGAFQPKDTVQANADSVRIGYNSDGSTPGWGTLSGLADGYVSVSGTNGVYTMTIPSGKLTGSSSSTDLTGSVNATTGVLTALTTSEKVKLVKAGAIEDLIDAETAQDTTTITGAVAGNGKVPTSKNVYDFVTTYAQDTYQPKVGGENSYDTTGNVSKVMIGYTTRSGTAPDYTYSSEWKPLTGTSYVNVGVNVESNLPEVSLNPSMITSSGASITAATGGAGSSSYNNLLPTAQAVNEFVTGLTGGLTIPEPTGDCANTNMTSTNDTACALVLAYWTAAESPTNQAGVGLKWVPMAQTVSSGSSGGGQG